MEDENFETHTRNRNKILLELKRIWRTDSGDDSKKLDAYNKMQPERKSLSPTADYLMELNPPELTKYAENNLSCYRCRHFLSIPPNLIQTACERISNCTEKYEADLAFVQAIVWLKSAVASGREISTEQFHSIFRKQWDCIENDRTIEPEKHNCPDLNSQCSDEEFDDEELAERTQEFSIECAEEDCNNSIIELLCNITQNNNEDNVEDCNRRQNSAIGSKTETILARIITPLSDGRCVSDCAENETIGRKIIPETDDDCSSISDIFRDNFEDENTSQNLRTNEINNSYLKTNNSQIGNKIQRLLEQSIEDIQDNRSESDIFVDKDDLSNTSPSQRNTSQRRNIIIEDSSSGALSKCSAFQEDRVIGDASLNMDGWSLDLRSQTITQWSEEHSFVLKCLSSNSEFNSQSKNVECTSSFSENELTDTPNKRKNNDSAYDTLIINNFLYDSVAKNDNRLETMKFRQTIHASYPHTTKQNLRLSKPFTGNKHQDFESESNFETTVRKLNESQVNNKKRKINLGPDRLSGNKPKRKKNMISSQWLNFIFHALNTDEVVFRSVKLILSFFEDERISKDYMKRRHWENTLEKEAINAVLNFCDIFKAEKHTDMYTQEVIETVIRTLEKVIGKSEMTEVALSISHLSIILELCNSMQVCTKVIDYLATKLKTYGTLLASLLNGEQAQMYRIVSQLQLIFYATNILLQKYQLVFSNIENYNVGEIVPAVVDLWKKQFSSSECVHEESRDSREKRWMKIFDEFAVFCSEDFLQFAEKSRVLYRMLMPR